MSTSIISSRVPAFVSETTGRRRLIVEVRFGTMFQRTDDQGGHAAMGRILATRCAESWRRLANLQAYS